MNSTRYWRNEKNDLFIFVPLDNLDATEIPEQTNVKRVAQLLSVPIQSLVDALTRRTIFASGETVVSISHNRVS